VTAGGWNEYGLTDRGCNGPAAGGYWNAVGIIGGRAAIGAATASMTCCWGTLCERGARTGVVGAAVLREAGRGAAGIVASS
jgi:hypothetical protein